jgi:methenyltetrahydromethanopterin cyclohydrolase
VTVRALLVVVQDRALLVERDDRRVRQVVVGAADCLDVGLVDLELARSLAELAALVERLPSSASPDYGTPFADIFARYDNDFYKIDPMLFSPASVWLTNVVSGRTFRAGAINPDVLRASLV